MSMNQDYIAKVIADAVRAQVGMLAAELNETIEIVVERVDQLDTRIRNVAASVDRNTARVGGMRDNLDARISSLEQERADTDEYRGRVHDKAAGYEYRDWVRDEAVRLGIVKAKKKVVDAS